MAERRITNKALAQKISYHEVTISKLKSSKTMPFRLEQETLDRLCAALECQPSDLLSWEPTIENDEYKEEEPLTLPAALIEDKPEPDSRPREKKNTKVLKAKAKKARTETWEELRKPLKMSK